MTLKYLIYITYLFSIFSCQAKNNGHYFNKKSKANVENRNTDSLFNGNQIISESDFIEKIDTSCIIKNSYYESLKDTNRINHCILLTSSFDDHFNQRKELFKSQSQSPERKSQLQNITLSLQKAGLKEKFHGIYIEPSTSLQIILNVYKNNTKTDSIAVFEYIDQIDYAYYLRKDYFIDEFLNLWILNLYTGEEGTNIISWKKHKIDKKTGKIILNADILNSTYPFKKTSNWKGEYYFESVSTKDKIKTIFKIDIVDLSNINVTIRENGDSYSYKAESGRVLADKKIEITYGKSEKLFIEKQKDKYFISGQPIYFINPGNESMPLKKIK